MLRRLLLLFLLAGSVYADDSRGALLDAVLRDDTELALQLIETEKNPDQQNRYGITPLHLACRNGNPKIVEALLKIGANPNPDRQNRQSPLMTAARTGKPELVKLLLRHGANINYAGIRGQTALIWAAAEGHAEAVEVLIGAGADPNQVLASGFTPLLFAARNGKSEVVDVLLRAGVDVNYGIEAEKGSAKAPSRGTSALLIAVENGHFELALKLLEAGADPDDQRSGQSALHVLTRVRKPNRGDGNDGMPPPRGSGMVTSQQFAEQLVTKFDGDVNIRLQRGSSGGAKFGTKMATPFLLASRTADLPYLKLLKQLGADPALQNQDGTSALLAAAGVGSRAPEEEAGTEKERLETLHWLNSLGCDVNHLNKNLETAMHGAAYKNVPQVARWLAEHGAVISVWNQPNKRGWTPLLIAQGFRPGNFKPSEATIAAISELMRAEGIAPPPAPSRPGSGGKY
ncbi:MAG: ankyrin repeat domain-containing protein [Verrucomicrobiales bacterium]|nr:ankyrin repeat domain-containing protein [Verrucomicrobiales bacterium]